MTTFLYPSIINLDQISFSKIDIEIGTGTMDSALFGVTSYGSIASPSITVNRISQEVTYATNPVNSGAFTGHTSGTASLQGSTNNGTYDQLTFSESLSGYPAALTNNSRPPDQVLSGAIFNYMVLAIFDGGSSLTTSLDLTQSANRSTGLFFVGDPTGGMVTDINTKTASQFNRVVTVGAAEDEYKYWNFRTSETGGPLETANVTFTAGDTIYIKYAVNGKVSDEDENINEANLDAITDSGDKRSPFVSATVAMTFILGWTVA